MEIPELELMFSFSRSSGRGGQNVNKVSTKATLRWNILESKILSDGQKVRLTKKLANRMDGEGNLLVYAQSERSQPQNRKEATEKLERMVAAALKPVKKRIKTKPTKASRAKRLEGKKKQGEKKQFRRKMTEVRD